MKHLPEIIAFTCGAVVMILELDGSRIVAPYLGTGTFVWTGLIGVILGSLSLGYWWGGKIADKSANFKTLAKILALAGLFVWSVAYLINLLGLALFFPNNMIAATLIGTTLLFSPATILLGMVTPYIARLKLNTLETSGRTIGNLYALSTLGSIIGTFLGGFILISFLGSIKIITILAATLFLLAAGAFLKNIGPCDRDRRVMNELADSSTRTAETARYSTYSSTSTRTLCKIRIFHALLACRNNPKDKLLILGCVALALIVLTLKPSPSFFRKIIVDTDTEYSRVWIFDDIDMASERPARYLSNNTQGLQSGMFLDDPDELIFPYTRLFDLAAEMYPDFKTALMIGAGAYSYPKHFAKVFPKSSLDVVEIDPKLKKLAAEYFNLKESPRVKFFDEDGRIFLNRNKTKYDVIWNDAFLSHLNIPFQLTTVEAVRKMSDALDIRGVVMTNVISPMSGTSAGFLQAEYLTYKQVFPSVFLVKVTDRPDSELQNIMLVAFKSSEDSLPLGILRNKFNIPVKNIFTPTINGDIPVLTDDFAPIEKYTAKMLL